MSDLPIDRDRPFTPRDYPNDPSEYTPLDHFIQRFKEPDRFLTPDVVNRTLKEGEVRDNGDGCACIVQDWDGVRYYFIAGYHTKGYRILITAWPVLYDRKKALDSGRWASSELDTIAKLNAETDPDFEEEWCGYAEWIQSQQQPLPAG